MGNWVQLCSGGGYDFDTDTIFGRYTMERDLAYPLAGIARYSRHTMTTWAVAIHSVAVALLLEKMTGDLDVAAAGLLHDAHESVTGDITTPIQWEIGRERIKEMQGAVQSAIETRLNVPLVLCQSVHAAIVRVADLASLHCERQLFMPPHPREWSVPLPPVEWQQEMHDIIVSLLHEGAHEDGGYERFVTEYRRLVMRRDPVN